jgi:hypothetical protein
VRVDDHAVAVRAADRRDGPEFELRIVVAEALLGYQVDALAALVEELGQLGDRDALRGGEDARTFPAAVSRTSVFATPSSGSPSARASSPAVSLCAWGITSYWIPAESSTSVSAVAATRVSLSPRAYHRKVVIRSG